MGTRWRLRPSFLGPSSNDKTNWPGAAGMLHRIESLMRLEEKEKGYGGSISVLYHVYTHPTLSFSFLKSPLFLLFSLQFVEHSLISSPALLPSLNNH